MEKRGSRGDVAGGSSGHWHGEPGPVSTLCLLWHGNNARRRGRERRAGMNFPCGCAPLRQVHLACKSGQELATNCPLCTQGMPQARQLCLQPPTSPPTPHLDVVKRRNPVAAAVEDAQACVGGQVSRQRAQLVVVQPQLLQRSAAPGAGGRGGREARVCVQWVRDGSGSVHSRPTAAECTAAAERQFRSGTPHASWQHPPRLPAHLSEPPSSASAL